MKKPYESPDFDLFRLRFESILEDPGDGGFNNIAHSIPEGDGEGEGGL